MPPAAVAEVRRLFELHGGRYGSPRIIADRPDAAAD
jgi:hypothetical protein